MKRLPPAVAVSFRIGLVVIGLTPAVVGIQAQEVDPIWNNPIRIGEVSVTLPAPSFSDSMDEQQQAQALKEVAGKYPVDRFLKDSIVAPFNFSRETIKNERADRIGHRIDLWFVAYGTLESIRDQDLFESMIESESTQGDDSGQALSSDELVARGLVSRRDDHSEMGFYRFTVGVIDRVQVRGILQGEVSSTERSHFASVLLDDRFNEDKEFPNQWRHLDANPQDWSPYSGLAGYAKATRLTGHGQAILVECHAVVHEPPEWFNGPNLLSSKLPLVTQDAVRKFRRTLGKH